MTKTPLETRKTIEQIVQIVDKGHRFLIAAHENPDGDAIGASIGLALILEKMGKQIHVYNRNAAPANLQFLPRLDLLSLETGAPDNFDAAIVLDCGDQARLGDISDSISEFDVLVNIDHHSTNDEFGTINLVDPSASSTGELIWQIATAGNWPISKDAAYHLFTAVYTDTSALGNSSAKPNAFHVCGEMVEKGVKPEWVFREYYVNQTEPRLRLLERALSTLRLDSQGNIAGLVLAEKDMKDTGTGPDDVEGFVEYPRSIGGVKVAYLLRDSKIGVKGSLRSNNHVDVAQIAATFGGGGHSKAAGFKTTGTLDGVRADLVEKLAAALQKES
jgi:bifunctional oligoribonuclease and PAP phosphatase NrnA